MRIHVRDIEAMVLVGVYPEERESPQPLRISISVEYDGREAARSDDLTHTVDYHALTKRVVDYVERTEFILLERLLEGVLDRVMEDPRAERASVEITKPWALQRHGALVSVAGERARGSA